MQTQHDEGGATSGEERRPAKPEVLLVGWFFIANDTESEQMSLSVRGLCTVVSMQNCENELQTLFRRRVVLEAILIFIIRKCEGQNRRG